MSENDQTLLDLIDLLEKIDKLKPKQRKEMVERIINRYKGNKEEGLKIGRAHV